jgi:hypothetical protein
VYIDMRKKVKDLEDANKPVPEHMVPPTLGELVGYGVKQDDETESDQENRERVQTWVTEHLAPCVRGAKEWRTLCSTRRLSETDYSPSDEAFAILASINMWAKWAKRDGLTADATTTNAPEVMDEKTRRAKARAEKGLFTNGGSNRKFAGWSIDGLVKYNELFKIAVARRKAAETPDMEERIKVAIRARLFSSVSLDDVMKQRIRKKKRGANPDDDLGESAIKLPKVLCNVDSVEI